MSETVDQDREDFDLLLAALSPDREAAGRQYERLRKRLVYYFDVRGCSEPLDLADETLSRVTKKIGNFDATLKQKFVSFVYGFAFNVYREDRRKQLSRAPIDGFDISLDRVSISESDNDRLTALERCLGKMPQADRELLMDYYTDVGDGLRVSEKRERLSVAAGCTISTLHTRMFRLRQRLANCVNLQLSV